MFTPTSNRFQNTRSSHTTFSQIHSYTLFMATRLTLLYTLKVFKNKMPNTLVKLGTDRGVSILESFFGFSSSRTPFYISKPWDASPCSREFQHEAFFCPSSLLLPVTFYLHHSPQGSGGCRNVRHFVLIDIRYAFNTFH